jgi:solute carrier family 10 (sodium/bile acid cotransporter), member 7
MLGWLRRHVFLVGLALVLAAAFFAPEIGKVGGPLSPERWQGWLVVGIFLSSGLELKTSDLRDAVRDHRLQIFVQGVSLVVAPIVFWAVARALGFTPLPAALLEGFVVLGCLPTTVTSGVAFTRASGGDEAGAVFNATLGNLLGIVVTPFSILLATGRHGSVPASAIAAQLGWQVAAPIACGQLLQWVMGARLRRFRPWNGPLSIVFLLVLIYLVFCESIARGFSVSALDVVSAIAIAALLHGALYAIALYASALSVFRFSRAKRTAAVIGSTQKTAALGLPLLAVLYQGDARLGLIALPLLIYHPLQLFVAGSATSAWRRFNGAAPPPDPTVPENVAR